MLEQIMTARDVIECMAYLEEEPPEAAADDRMAVLATVVGNTSGNLKKGKAIKPENMVAWRQGLTIKRKEKAAKVRKAKPQTAAEQKAVLRDIAKSEAL